MTKRVPFWKIATIVTGLVIIIITCGILIPIENANDAIRELLKDETEIYISFGIYSRFGNDNESGRHGIVVRDQRLIKELIEALRTEYRIVKYWCACDGYPIIELKNGKAISIHHETSLRCSGLSGNFTLYDNTKLLSWYRKVGILPEEEMINSVQQVNTPNRASRGRRG